MYDGVTMFFFISLSLSLSSKKIRHETTGCFEILEAARFTIESSPRVIPRPSWPIIHHLSRRSVTSRKDEISFHETSERNTWRFPSWRHHAPPLFLSFATFEAAVGRNISQVGIFFRLSPSRLYFVAIFREYPWFCLLNISYLSPRYSTGTVDSKNHGI